MAKRDNHYEAAFEEFLRARQIAYVAVDEARRSRLADGSLKSLDFIVTARCGWTWLVDVKGRRFPSGEGKQYWKNWSTRDDLESLTQWEQLFGEQAGALLVFAYNVIGLKAPLPREMLFEFRGALYGFVGIRLQDYASCAKLISSRWNTLAMPRDRFRQLAAPLDAFLA